MAGTFRLTLAQMNPTVGDLEGNAALAKRAWKDVLALAGGDQKLKVLAVRELGQVLDRLGERDARSCCWQSSPPGTARVRVW